MSAQELGVSQSDVNELRLQAGRMKKATAVANVVLNHAVNQALCVLETLTDEEWYSLCVEAKHTNREKKPPSAESRAMVIKILRSAKCQTPN